MPAAVQVAVPEHLGLAPLELLFFLEQHVLQADLALDFVNELAGTEPFEEVFWLLGQLLGG